MMKFNIIQITSLLLLGTSVMQMHAAADDELALQACSKREYVKALPWGSLTAPASHEHVSDAGISPMHMADPLVMAQVMCLSGSAHDGAKLFEQLAEDLRASVAKRVIAFVNLGILYEFGSGIVQVDKRKAIESYKQALNHAVGLSDLKLEHIKNTIKDIPGFEESLIAMRLCDGLGKALSAWAIQRLFAGSLKQPAPELKRSDRIFDIDVQNGSGSNNVGNKRQRVPFKAKAHSCEICEHHYRTNRDLRRHFDTTKHKVALGIHAD